MLSKEKWQKCFLKEIQSCLPCSWALLLSQLPQRMPTAFLTICDVSVHACQKVFLSNWVSNKFLELVLISWAKAISLQPPCRTPICDLAVARDQKLLAQGTVMIIYSILIESLPYQVSCQMHTSEKKKEKMKRSTRKLCPVQNFLTGLFNSLSVWPVCIACLEQDALIFVTNISLLHGLLRMAFYLCGRVGHYHRWQILRLHVADSDQYW